MAEKRPGEGVSAADRFVQRLVDFILRRRFYVLAVLLTISAFWLYFATSVQMFSRFSDLLPQGHEYIQAYNKFRPKFGGANIVNLALAVKEGDVFNVETLEKIRHVTNELDKIQGVDHYQVGSISHLRIRNITTTSGGMVKSLPVLPDDIPTEAEALKELKRQMFNNPLVFGKYLSDDGKAALIQGGFTEERLDYARVHAEIMRIRSEVEDDNHILYAAGEPLLKGWVWYYTGELYLIFSVTAVFIFLTLIVYFRRLYGVILPVLAVMFQATWGMGFLGLMGYNLDPLILVIPLLIMARAASHAVQMIERFLEELENTGEKRQAVRNAMGELFLPGFIAICTDAAGVFVLSVATIPLIRNMAYFASFWLFCNVFAVLLLVPLLLDTFPAPRTTAHYTPAWMVRLLHGFGVWATQPAKRMTILAIAGLITLYGIRAGTEIQFGEAEAGSPLLFQDSDFNISSREINEQFAGSQHLVIYMEGSRPHVLKKPELLAMIENFRRYMLEQEEAGGSRALPTLVASINRLYHYGDPKWEVIPPTTDGIGQMLVLYEIGAPVPGMILEYADLEAQNGQLVIFYKDAKGTTIEKMMERAKRFIAAHPQDEVKFVLAGGIEGVTAALNEELEYSDRVSLSLLTLVIFIIVSISYRSFTAGFYVIATLIAAGVASFIYIVWYNIGMSINTLPVACVGMGVGVDYIIYITDRIMRECTRTGDVDEAIRRAISTTGMAVTFTATTLIGGIIPWVFLSSLRFSAEMAVLLAILMFTHWLVAVTLVPAMASIGKPKFLTRLAREQAAAESPSGAQQDMV